MAVEKIQIIYTDVSSNDYKVPQKQWRKWNESQRWIFNIMYSSMTDDPKLFQHPKSDIPYKYWETVAWNAAWNAAELIQKHILTG